MSRTKYYTQHTVIGCTDTVEGDIPHAPVEFCGLRIEAPVVVESSRHGRGNVRPVRNRRWQLLYALPGGYRTTAPE